MKKDLVIIEIFRRELGPRIPTSICSKLCCKLLNLDFSKINKNCKDRF